MVYRQGSKRGDVSGSEVGAMDASSYVLRISSVGRVAGRAFRLGLQGAGGAEGHVNVGSIMMSFDGVCVQSMSVTRDGRTEYSERTAGVKAQKNPGI